MAVRTESTIAAFERSSKAQIKFDYFMCGVAGALFAYIAQTYAPQKLDNCFSILQTASLLMLAISFYCGIKRIQTTNAVLRLNYKTFNANDVAENITGCLKDEKALVATHAATGKPTTRQELEGQRANLLQLIDNYKKEVLVLQKKGNRLGWIQVNFLFFGFLLILVAKISQPYQSDFSPRPNATNRTMNTPVQSLAGNQSNLLTQP